MFQPGHYDRYVTTYEKEAILADLKKTPTQPFNFDLASMLDFDLPEHSVSEEIKMTLSEEQDFGLNAPFPESEKKAEKNEPIKAGGKTSPSQLLLFRQYILHPRQTAQSAH